MLEQNISTDQNNIFISYAHEDQARCDRLIAHLSNLRNQGVISDWYDRLIRPGQSWDREIQEQLASARIILLLVSADFMRSDYVNDHELTVAMERHARNEAVVIPIILSPCDWEGAPFSQLLALPQDATPVSTWPDEELAWLNVVQGIRRAVQNLSVSQTRGRVRVDQRRNVTRPGIFRYLLDRYLPSLHRFLTNLGTLSKPTETDVLNDYLRTARATIENDIRHKTYIPLSGKEVSSTPLQGGAGTDPFVPPVQRVIRQVVGVERGGDSASAQIAAVNRTSRVIRNLIKTLLSSIEPLVLLGDPGTGKTMTLQQTAMVLFDSEIRRVFPIVTLYVRLGEFFVEGRVGPEHVWSYIKASVSPQISPYLEELDSAGRLIVLFDGMDEMSRDRYGEHTEALSMFAASRRGRTKTLFSCRITDFSPRFMHRRLVLLPFNDEQIGEYLRRYIPSFPITIEGQSWSINRLVKQLLLGSLPMEATNPFVLWLLCFQLQQKGSWPASRVELLRFYIEENYRRKAEDVTDDDEPFPRVEQALAGWSRFAYTITSLNRGSAIAVPTLVEDSRETGVDVEELIRVGERCGVLQESMSGEERQVRFEHHRFQEFFTALFINEQGTAIDWLEKLDTPRWQETMVNVILMGGGEDAIRILATAIEDEVHPIVTDLATTPLLDVARDALSERHNRLSNYEREFWREKYVGYVEQQFSPERETLLADRIELASRIVRQAGASSALVNTLLTQTVKKAATFLSEYGNPITQVKMMRAFQNVPAVDIFEVLQSSLKSPINWIRNQALIIVSSSNRGPRVVGSHFASELGYDLANGLLPLRLKAYFKAAAVSKRVRNWWALAVGTVCYSVNIFLLLAFAALFYSVFWAVLTISPVAPFVNVRIYIVACAILVTAAVGLSIKYDLSRIWMAILAPAYGVVALALIVLAASTGLGFAIVITILTVQLGALLTAVVGIPVAVGFHFLVLALYLGATVPVRRSVSSLRSFFATAWRDCSYRAVFISTGKFAGSALLLNAVWFVPILLWHAGFWLSRVSRLPFSVPINLLIILCSVAIVVALSVAVVRRNVRSIPKVAGYILVGGVGAVLIAAAIFGAGWLVAHAALLLDKLPLSGILAPILAGVAVLLVVIGIVYTLWLFRRKFRVLLLWRNSPTATKSISPEDWQVQLANADADLQRLLLSETNHQTLGLRADEFLRILEDVGTSIREEPALSTYWDKRDRLEQVLKQERQG